MALWLFCILACASAQTQFRLAFQPISTAGADLSAYQRNRWSKEVDIQCADQSCFEKSEINYQVIQRTGCGSGPYTAGSLGSYCRATTMDGDVFGALPNAQGEKLPSACYLTSSSSNGGSTSTCYYESNMTGGVEQNKGSEEFPYYSVNPNPQVGSAFYKGDLISNSPDYVSYLPNGHRLFSFVHFEAFHPSNVQMLEETFDGRFFRAISNKVVNTSEDGGIMNPCAGTTSPWCTHLGSEEAYSTGSYDGRSQEAMLTEADFKTMVTDVRYGLLPFFIYKGGSPSSTLAEFKATISSYEYGWRFECRANDGDPTCRKLYAIGRGEAELIRCAPDRRTCYITEDAQNGYLGLFIAKTPADLSEGRLYVARLTQRAEVDAGTCVGAACAGEFDFDWVPLYNGDVKSSDIKARVRSIRFSDMWDYAPYNASGEPRCPAGFRSVNNGHRDPVNTFPLTPGAECLRLKPGMDLWASRFETRRYACYMGATTEWHKLEGFDFAPELRRAFASVSVVQAALLDGGVNNERTVYTVGGAVSSRPKSDAGGPNHVRLPYNPCGCVMEFNLSTRAVDGSAPSDFIITAMRGLVCGKPVSSDRVLGNSNGNTCDVDGISEPDTLAWGGNHGTLFIGEDTNTHVQDILWAYDYSARTLTRIFASVHGSEITGLSWNQNFMGSGASYLGISVQHPYGEDNGAKLFQPNATGLWGWVGVLGPFRMPRAVLDMARPEDMEQSWGCRGDYRETVGRPALDPRVTYLVGDMMPSPLKEALTRCVHNATLKMEVSEFTVGNRGAPLMFPDNTRESYSAAISMGAGVVAVEAAMTSDGQLVCRSDQVPLGP